MVAGVARRPVHRGTKSRVRPGRRARKQSLERLHKPQRGHSFSSRHRPSSTLTGQALVREADIHHAQVQAVAKDWLPRLPLEWSDGSRSVHKRLESHGAICRALLWRRETLQCQFISLGARLAHLSGHELACSFGPQRSDWRCDACNWRHTKRAESPFISPRWDPYSTREMFPGHIHLDSCAACRLRDAVAEVG
jgi:hypothetical protein